MDPEELIEKLDWLFKSPLSSNRYNTQEFKEEQFRFFRELCSFSPRQWIYYENLVEERRKGNKRIANKGRRFNPRRTKILCLRSKKNGEKSTTVQKIK